MPKRLDLKDRKFGRLLVTGPAPKLPGQIPTRWAYQCECGSIGNATTKHLISGDTRSCGCLLKESIRKHGHARGAGPASRTYSIWGGMISRCKDKSNRYYGGHGIMVCMRWLKFENFLTDMRECPPGMTIERIRSSTGYEPGNCKWATVAEQNWNKSNVILIEFNGKAIPLKELARQLSIPYHRLCFWHRVKGLRIDEAVKQAKISGRWAIR